MMVFGFAIHAVPEFRLSGFIAVASFQCTVLTGISGKNDMQFKLMSATLILLGLSCCHGNPPEHPGLTTVKFTKYSNDTLGFSVEIPSFYSVNEDGQDTVIFRMDGYPVLMVNLLTEKRAEKRGLWARSAVHSAGSLSGMPAKHYRYDHFDGPFAMHTISWVVPWQRKYLEFALRTNATEPDSVQQHIKDSFQLIP